MADFDNYSELNENFDTIKTLLNSIRAQGILNTSDVDKLLSGINAKLEKINTEEDIDLIKIFLSELKQNLEERHGVLISKFGAIESLFSNLLRNSSELPKSSELKELFDIVATNLSVFSREVVSQKESLTEISLRLDALRSDDSQKKDIIKNITLLKSDLERLINGFDSIVISLNDNFKTIVKTITTIDKTEHLDKFADSLSNIEMSSNTVLSALQMLDKKTVLVEEALHGLATKEDVNSTNQRLFELTAHSQELNASVVDLSERYVRIDHLADKIDASVNIIASLKAVLEEADDKSTRAILERLGDLDAELSLIKTDTKFDDFKNGLQEVISKLVNNTELLNSGITLSKQEIEKLSQTLKSLDINVNLQSLHSNIAKTENELKNYIDVNTQKIVTLQDANITRVLNDISNGADTLAARLNQAQSEVSVLCEKNFSSVFDNVKDLKTLVSQIDENAVSANNAIFSNITDRLTMFENNLRESLETQEKTIAESSAQLVEHVENIKNISSVLDYKMDSSVVEVGNVKREFNTLKSAIEAVLALDFVNTVKDLRVDLYASKQELANAVDAATTNLSDKFTDDLYGKYELLISKLDTVEDEFKKTQTTSLGNLKTVLDKISDSLVDVLSYVSETQNGTLENLDSKFASITNVVKENSMNYVESVRDVVDVIRVQVENNLKSIQEDVLSNLDTVKRSISENSQDLKTEIKYSYSKLLEIQDTYNEIKEILNVNTANSTDKIENLFTTTESIRNEFDTRLTSLKTVLLDRIGEFKQEFTCENADKISEIKFSVEDLYNKNFKDVSELVSELRILIAKLSDDDSNSRAAALAKVLDNFIALKELMHTLNDKTADVLAQKVDVILADFDAVKAVLNKVDENVDADMTRQLSIIENNFESLVSQITILFEKADNALVNRINSEFSTMSEKMQELVDQKLESYKDKIENTFETLQAKTIEQSEYLQERIAGLNTALKSMWEEQSDENYKQIEEVADRLKAVLDENIKLTAVDYVSLKNKLKEFAGNIEDNNKNLTQDLKAQLDDITKYIDSVLEIQAQEALVKQEELKDVISQAAEKSLEENKSSLNLFEASVNDVLEQVKVAISNAVSATEKLSQENKEALKQNEANVSELVEKTATASSNENKSLFAQIETAIADKFNTLKSIFTEVSAGELQALDGYICNLAEQLELQKQAVEATKNALNTIIKEELKLTSQNIEKETDVIIAELIEQFDIIKKSQADDVVNLTSRMEEIVNAHIYNNIEDLKSYLDIKTDSSVLSSKLDNLKIEMSTSIENVITNLNKMLSTEVFTTAMADFKLANELLINTAVDGVNNKIQAFIKENNEEITSVLNKNGKEIQDKLALFDKKFIDTVVDKYEEIKLATSKYNEAFSSIQNSFREVFSQFENVKDDVNSRIEQLEKTILTSADSTNKEIASLNQCLENLRSQISNKSFDEAFQASINKQISSLENLISDQLGYIEDINELCVTNLPDVAELNALVKHTVLDKLNSFNEKLEKQDIEATIDSELKVLKSDIITQFLNIFNQISFVAEQEEILDFIQDKHDELITILSHIVTTADEISDVKDNVAVVDGKINELRDDIELLNEKITAIMSSDGDIDYVYSLHDLESDIANLRLALNEIKTNDHGQDFADLISSTNEIYNLVESVKTELPTKTDFEGMAEDIMSISTRTNKLILASDESYKSLQDNLQDFKLVINDLDERTRNFAEDAGINRIDSKLNAINSMVTNGAKTNQVFNQVFEYLAEWVDNASVQINSISNKVETLDDISQIKDMLAELKAGAEDNTESVELIEALGDVFDKQAKKISTLEKKLDKIIVETTVNNKVDFSSMEDTLNKFLVAMEEKLSTQQDKISSLEEKLMSIASLADSKETAQLTKKVGGMDKQIAKLNKSIEKIAAHVIEE